MKSVLDIENIPNELKELPNWVLFDENKIPLQTNGHRASVTNPKHWSTFEEVVESYTLSELVCRGIGVVAPPTREFTFLDFDNCVDDQGNLSDLAKEWMEGVEGYAELSPSGKGIHIISRTTIPASKKIKGIEIYNSARYFTVTGNTLNDHGKIPNTPQDISGIVNKYFGETSYQKVVDEGDIFANLKPIAANWSIQEIEKRILSRFNPDMEFPQWLETGMGIHHQTQGSVEGLELWKKWSSQGNKFKSGECERRWRTFNNTSTNAVTLATLIHRANEIAPDRKSIEEPMDVQPLQKDLFAPIHELAFRDPIPLKWLWENLIPEGYCTALYGRGGIGKSVLALQLGVCVANGIPLFGIQTGQGRVLGIFSEDDNEIILRRAKAIFQHYELHDYKECSKNLDIWGAAGVDQLMLGFDRTGKRVEHKPFKRLELQLKEAYEKGEGYKLLILDNIAQIFGGDEINRSNVTSFVGALTGLASRYECAVFLIGHVAKQKDSEWSGSTAWDGSLRSRLFINMNDDGTTTLGNPKANYGKNKDLLLQMENIVFKKLDNSYSDAQKQALKNTIKLAIIDYTDKQETTSHSKSAPNNVIEKMIEDGKLPEKQKREAKSLLAEMVKNEEILTKQKLFKKEDRHWATGLQVVGEVSPLEKELI